MERINLSKERIINLLQSSLDEFCDLNLCNIEGFREKDRIYYRLFYIDGLGIAEEIQDMVITRGDFVWMLRHALIKNSKISNPILNFRGMDPLNVSIKYSLSSFNADMVRRRRL